MTEPNPKEPPQDRPASIGIYIGPGSKNVRTDSNTFIGLDRAIEDHGSENTHTRNEFYQQEREPIAERPQRSKQFTGWRPPPQVPEVAAPPVAEPEQVSGETSSAPPPQQEGDSKHHSDNSALDQWYKRPLGNLALEVAAVVLGAAALWVLAHYFGLLK